MPTSNPDDYGDSIFDLPAGKVADDYVDTDSHRTDDIDSVDFVSPIDNPYEDYVGSSGGDRHTGDGVLPGDSDANTYDSSWMSGGNWFDNLGGKAKALWDGLDAQTKARIIGGGVAGVASLTGNKFLNSLTGAGPTHTFTAPQKMTATRTALPQRTNGRYLSDVTYAAHGGMMPGGIAQGMAHGGRYLQGATDGMADKLDTSIDGHQPAKLSHGEFVIPADVVSHLGNGNSDAGAKKLYQMMAHIRKARTGNPKQGKQINPDKFMPGGIAKLAGGGEVRGFAGPTGPTGSAVTGLPAGTTGLQTGVSDWASPYVNDMLSKGQALADADYQTYQGPLTAGASALQTQGFDQATNLKTPDSIGQAAATAGDIAGKAQNLSYDPSNYASTYNPSSSTYNPTQYTNQFNAPDQYQAGTFDGGTFDQSAAQQYMNPYLQSVLTPQLAEQRRQAQITQMGNDAKMVGAGAFGGDRQALMTAENQRNLMQQQDQTFGQGYSNAFNAAMGQFNQDKTRGLQAQQYGEQSRQFGANQGMTAAQAAAQYGQANNALNSQNEQFGANFGLQNAQNAAQYGQAANALNAQDKQFGANFGLQGLNTALQGAQTQGTLGVQQGQSNIANLNAILNAGGTQRDIEQQGITANVNAFNAERDNPYKMLQMQQSLLQGLPISATDYTVAQPTIADQIAGGSLSGDALWQALFGDKKATTPTTPTKP